MERESPQKDTRNFAKRLNDATAGGLLGVIAGKVKFRDQMVSNAAAVLIGGAVFRREGVVLGFAVAIVIAVGCALLIRLRKWKVGPAPQLKRLLAVCPVTQPPRPTTIWSRLTRHRPQPVIDLVLGVSLLIPIVVWIGSVSPLLAAIVFTVVAGGYLAGLFRKG